MHIHKDALFIVDGSYLLYRSFYAIRPLYTIDGRPTQATYGFVRALKKIIDDYAPRHLVIAWDSKGPTFRNELYTEYKATRQAAPDQLIMQKQDIMEFIQMVGIAQLAVPGFEADDIIYSLVQDYADKHHIVLVCPDKDLFQLLSDKVIIFDPFKGRLVDAALYEKEKEMPVSKIAFFYSLLGDASDNIPGVKGIGQKTALGLVQQFESLEDLYQRLDEVKKDRARELLASQKEQAFLSLQLFSFRHCDCAAQFNDFVFEKQQWVRAAPLFERLEFKTLLQEIERMHTPVFKHAEPEAAVVEKQPWECVLVDDEVALNALVHKLKSAPLIALDTETTGLNALREKLVGISVAVDDDCAYYIPVGHAHGKQLPLDYVVSALKPICEDAARPKVLHNAKFDYLVLHSHGIEVKGIVFDTLLAANLVRNAWQKIGLKDLSQFFLGESMQTYEEVVGKKAGSFAGVSIDKGARYAAHDALQTLKLHTVFVEMLAQEPLLQQLFERVEMPLLCVLCAMELEGIALDVAVLAHVEQQVEKERRLIEDKFFSALEDKVNPLSFNMNSPKQVEWLLFDILHLPVVKKSAAGQRSTDQEVLDELAKISPIAGLIVRYRELTKLKSTYLQPLPEAINPRTGKIHTSYSQTMVATGRLSSSNPNLQNIPTGSEFGLHIRSAFKPPHGKLFLSADYSQIELRVLAHMTGDKVLQNAFKHDQDIHLQTAAQLFDVAPCDVNHEQRQLGKKINFSIIYGLTPFGLSKDLGIKPSQAKAYIDKYFAQYPGVGAWIDALVQEAIERGYVQTLWGHRRYVPGLREKNRNIYEAERRVAVNTPVQGTAADIMKFAMLRVDKAFKEHELDAQMVLQIHDELVIQFRPENEDIVKKLVASAMEDLVDWEIPLKVSMRIGSDWGEVTK